MSTFMFESELAKTYGTNEAVILQNLIFWIKKNKANNKHLHSGKYWTYNSAKAFEEIFDFVSARQINRVIDKLAKMGAILKGNYNKSAYDRTLWFTLTDELYTKYVDIDFPNSENGKTNSDKCHFPNSENGKTKSETPIPDINTDFKNADKKHTPKNGVCVELVSDEVVKELEKEIEATTGHKVSAKKVKDLISKSSVSKIRYHLSNWNIHKEHQKVEGAGWFFTVVTNDILPVKQKISNRDNFKQREYSDEDLEKFYTNLNY